MIIPFSLRNRFIATLAITFLVVLAALAYVFEYVTVPALRLEEEQNARLLINQVQDHIDNELGELKTLSRHWANGDAIHDAMRTAPALFAARQLDRHLFEHSRLSLAVLTDTHRRITWVAGIDPASGAFTSCPSATNDCAWAYGLTQVTQTTLIKEREATPRQHTRLISAPTLAMFSQRPILRGDGSGPSAGTLTVVRLMSADWLAQLRRSMGLDIAIKDIAGPPPTTRWPSSIDYLDDARLRVSMRRPAQPDGHHLLINVTLPLDQLHSGVAKYRLALMITVGLLAVIMLVALLAFYRTVLKPLANLSDYAQHLHFEGHEERVPSGLLARQDEIGMMVRKFQDVIDYLNARTTSFEVLSYTDALTGLGNRRLLDERLPQLLAVTHRLDHPVALILIDVDHFKAFNDYYGHPEGDACLKTISATLAGLFQRESDLVARIGGEEFVVVLPDTGPERAMDIANSIRAAVVARHIRHAASPTYDYVTISTGVAVSRPSQQQTLNAEALLKAADRSLYEAKRNGRNKTGRVKLDNNP